MFWRICDEVVNFYKDVLVENSMVQTTKRDVFVEIEDVLDETGDVPGANQGCFR